MKKQFLRVKQIADQTFLRAEKSDVLTEDLLLAEKRVDSIKTSCQTTQKKITACQIDFTSEMTIEKRLKKIPQVLLGASMLENGNSFFKNSVLGDTLRECGTVQSKLGSELLDYYCEVEKIVLKPISRVLDNEVHNISKLRKQLGKLVLDMDSARTRFQTAEKHSLQASSNNHFNTVGKMDNLKEEMEDASQKVEQCRDLLATEMFTLISKEPQLAEIFVQLHQLQAAYHRNALAALEASLPLLNNIVADFPQKPVYGCSLEDHLRVTQREVAQVIETCVSFLLEYGLSEEGLLRITGSASKLKKIKSAFDAGIEVDIAEYIRDPHSISGAFKSYLRELPEPLMTYGLYNEWMNAAKLTDFESRLQALWQVLHSLPEANFINLKYVIKFLTKVHEAVDVNKMSSQNIAIVMAPNLIWSPAEDPSTLGMNMSTASLHTAIVDMLISYYDWFFPEKTDSCDSLSVPTAMPNLNEAQKIVGNDSYNSETEVNGNNLLQVTNSSVVPPPSPGSTHKNLKKPAAPPPPVQELIDFSVDGAAPEDCPKKDDPDLSQVVFRNEKPLVPDKPCYSTYSLDRKATRHGGSGGNRASRGGRTCDVMSRSSHIERPSVPPPERPTVKAGPPHKASSSENLSAEVVDAPEGCATAPEDAPVRAVPQQQHVRSTSRGNRFDFLVTQREERPPPERPPRSLTGPTADGAEESGVSAPECSPPPPVSPRSGEAERVKPPRPQPPVPAKPKLQLQTENTSL